MASVVHPSRQQTARITASDMGDPPPSLSSPPVSPRAPAPRARIRRSKHTPPPHPRHAAHPPSAPDGVVSAPLTGRRRRAEGRKGGESKETRERLPGSSSPHGLSLARVVLVYVRACPPTQPRLRTDVWSSGGRSAIYVATAACPPIAVYEMHACVYEHGTCRRTSVDGLVPDPAIDGAERRPQSVGSGRASQLLQPRARWVLNHIPPHKKTTVTVGSHICGTSSSPMSNNGRCEVTRRAVIVD